MQRENETDWWNTLLFWSLREIEFQRNGTQACAHTHIHSYSKLLIIRIPVFGMASRSRHPTMYSMNRATIQSIPTAPSFANTRAHCLKSHSLLTPKKKETQWAPDLLWWMCKCRIRNQISKRKTNYVVYSFRFGKCLFIMIVVVVVVWFIHNVYAYIFGTGFALLTLVIVVRIL